MSPVRILAAALAIALACAGTPAHPLPLVGGLDIGLTWSPGHPPAGGNVTFNASAADGDGSMRIASLCFGDGSPCSHDVQSPSPFELAAACVFGDTWNRQFIHRFPNRTGTYTVSLSVTTRGCPGLPDETANRTYSIAVG